MPAAPTRLFLGVLIAAALVVHLLAALAAVVELSQWLLGLTGAVGVVLVALVLHGAALRQLLGWHRRAAAQSASSDATPARAGTRTPTAPGRQTARARPAVCDLRATLAPGAPD